MQAAWRARIYPVIFPVVFYFSPPGNKTRNVKVQVNRRMYERVSFEFGVNGEELGVECLV